MSDEIASALQGLLGINKSVLSELAARGIVVQGKKRGTYALQASVSGYCEHLRSMAAEMDEIDRNADLSRDGKIPPAP